MDGRTRPAYGSIAMHWPRTHVAVGGGVQGGCVSMQLMPTKRAQTAASIALPASWTCPAPVTETAMPAQPAKQLRLASASVQSAFVVQLLSA